MAKELDKEMLYNGLDKMDSFVLSIDPDTEDERFKERLKTYFEEYWDTSATIRAIVQETGDPKEVVQGEYALLSACFTRLTSYQNYMNALSDIDKYFP